MKPENIQELAIINLGGIGDEILFSPVLFAIKEALPHVRITLILEKRSKSVVELLPGVDEVMAIDIQGMSRPSLMIALTGMLRSRHFDAVLSSGSSPFIALMLFLSGITYRVGYASSLGFLLSKQAPLNKTLYAAEMYYALAETFLTGVLGDSYKRPATILPILKYPSERELAWAGDLMSASRVFSENLPKILIHPGVSQMSIDKNILKGWSATAWAKLIQDLTANAEVFLAGGPDDADITHDILALLPDNLPNFHNLLGKTENLRQLSTLIQEADVLVSVDSAPLHLAIGFHTPVVAMFGPTDPKKLVPELPWVKTIQLDELKCRPCLWDVRQTSCNNPVCLEVEPEDMAKAVHQWLSREHLSGPARLVR